ncbi:uncharacterized protein DUF1801 [Flavobacterium endophyticum]|uniref:Uncharacterized protein DUF1801 n=1 Tax=Flavobacterium endophyticum TaxID=1540163 RepID=A0A495M314_9FLAO|nr:DUF1801 domain-containing protein [Flavobacterium endophyticum]RKS20457.1 uncharacterized protein DUF1801 [Flavobacterium endophyticum]
MQSTAKNPQEYLDSLPDDRKEAIGKLRNSILEKLPKGFEESMNYGMLCYNVPFSIYPNGYHCNPEMPLPFLSLASQKNFIALYHMGIYADPELLNWFVAEYPKHSKQKLDMGKSCIRFKKMDQIPYELIAELLGKITPEKWIEMYESAFSK